MADVHDKETRSYNISQIKSRNTKSGLPVRKFLHAKRINLYFRGGRKVRRPLNMYH